MATEKSIFLQQFDNVTIRKPVIPTSPTDTIMITYPNSNLCD